MSRKVKLSTSQQADFDRMLFDFGQEFRKWRVYNNYNQIEVAKMLGLEGKHSKGAISMIENGKRNITLPMILKAAAITGHKIELKWKPIAKNEERKEATGSKKET